MGYSLGSPPSKGFAGFKAVAVNADTVMDASHIGKFVEVTCGAVDRTLTLPAAQDGDEMLVTKADTGAGKVKFAALAGVLGLAWLADQFDWLHLHYSGNLGWLVIAQSNLGPRYRSGSYIGPEAGSFGAAANGSAAWLMFTPLNIKKRVTLAGMGVQVTTAGAAATFLQLGLYTSKDGMADTLLAQTPFASNQVPGDVVGDAYRDFVGGNLAIPAGIYWMAVGVSSAAIAVNGIASPGIRSIMAGIIGSTGPTAALANNTGFSTSSGFVSGTAMPANPPTGFTGRGGTNAMTAVVKVA